MNSLVNENIIPYVFSNRLRFNDSTKSLRDIDCMMTSIWRQLNHLTGMLDGMFFLFKLQIYNTKRM